MKWSYLLYGLVLGLLLVALQYFRYRFVVLTHATEWYIGVIALVFTVLGIWAGLSFRKRHTVAENIAPAPEHRQEPGAALQQLGITPREHEVLLLMCAGYSNQEIADQLFVSLNTVKTHVANLFSKLDVQRRTQAIQKAQSLGLLSPPKG